MSTVETWGYWQFYVDGTDVTTFRGATASARYTLAEPFGCMEATISIPAVTPLDTPGSGALSWLTVGSPVDIARLHPDGTTVTSIWSGEVDGWEINLDDNSGRVDVTCIGDMNAASLQNWQPPPAMDVTDIGTVIADALNSVVGHRYGSISRVTTDITTTSRGSEDQSVMAYVADLLSTAVTDSGNGQWTVIRTGPRTYAIRLKDRTTVHQRVQAGGQGIRLRLTHDAQQAPNRYYGQGVTVDGFAWGNYTYPGASSDAAPPYPYSSPSNVINIGTTDADTDTGAGVSLLQQRINDLNITGNLVVDGVYNTNDANAVRQIQRYYGLLVDGIVGGQTWAATFNVGAGATLGGIVRLPLAWAPAVVPRLWHADGSDAGANPSYDSSSLLVDQDLNFGAGVSKGEGIRAARALLARDYPTGLAGQITLALDPVEGSRFAVEAGQNIRVYSVNGRNALMHIAGVDVDTDSTVTLAVDEKARDLLNLVQVMQRKRDNSVSPNRLPKSIKARRGLQTHDAVVPYDGESPGGRVPTFALYAGLWSVIHIPVSQAGRLAKTYFRTSPATKFAVGFFGAAVVPSQLVAWVGNPLASATPWTPSADAMRDAGWIEGWGSSDSACGQQANGTVDGKFLDEGTLEYRSSRPPWIWIALYSPISTFITGRLYPAPLDA